MNQAEHYHNYITCHPDGPLRAVRELIFEEGQYHHQTTSIIGKNTQGANGDLGSLMAFVTFTDNSYLIVSVRIVEETSTAYVDSRVQEDLVYSTLNFLANVKSEGVALTPEEESILKRVF